MDVNLYLAVKALHIVAFTAWMAGIFYLPRLFVYHTRYRAGEPTYELFLTMESKLLGIIMGPAAVATWVLGLLLAFDLFSGSGWPPLWFYIKLSAVALMSWFHWACVAHHRNFVAGRNEKAERYYRMFNEIPSLLLVVIVFSVIFQPQLA